MTVDAPIADGHPLPRLNDPARLRTRYAAEARFRIYGVAALSIAIAFLINWNGHGLALHWAFLIVFGFYLLLAGILALVGLRKVKRVKAPERAIHQAQETAAALKRS